MDPQESFPKSLQVARISLFRSTAAPHNRNAARVSRESGRIAERRPGPKHPGVGVLGPGTSYSDTLTCLPLVCVGVQLSKRGTPYGCPHPWLLERPKHPALKAAHSININPKDPRNAGLVSQKHLRLRNPWARVPHEVPPQKSGTENPKPLLKKESRAPLQPNELTGDHKTVHP